MIRRLRGRWNEERGLLLAGLVGLGAVLFFACAGDEGPGAGNTEGATSVDGGATSGNGGATSGGRTRWDDTDPPLELEIGRVGPACANDGSTAEHEAAVADAANALIALLPPGQQAAIQYEKTLANAQRWSNVPGPYGRNGVKLGDMSADAQAAALALVDVAAGPLGAALFEEIREAEELLIAEGDVSPEKYGRGMYFFSIHGKPGAASAWMLQIAGHHLAYNFMYGGACASATPLFDGIEPAAWMGPEGRHAPLGPQRAALVALLASVGSLPGANLAAKHGELVNGIVYNTSADTSYPDGLSYPTGSEGRGVRVATLSEDQKALVETAIEAWVSNVAEPVSSALLAEYLSPEALAETFVGYSGSPALEEPGSYARIDGPRVWIEFSVRSGVVYEDRGHYHTLWRDKAADYGAEFVSP